MLKKSDQIFRFCCRKIDCIHKIFKNKGEPLSSTHRFHARTTLFQHRKSLSSTPKTPQFNTKIPQFHTKNPSVQGVCGTEGVLNWGELRGFWCGTEGFSVLTRGFWCWTEGFLVLNWWIFGAEKVWFLCGTDVLNWGGLCGTEWYSTWISILTCQWLLLLNCYDEVLKQIILKIKYLNLYNETW